MRIKTLPACWITVATLSAMGGCCGHEQTVMPATQPISVRAPASHEQALYETVLRDQLKEANRDTVVFISVGPSESGWQDPSPDLMKRLADLPARLKPASLARLPKSGEMEAANRFRGVEDPATGKRTPIVSVQIERWTSETIAVVNIGRYSGPLSGGGMTCIYELRDGRWQRTSIEDSWVS